MNALHSGTFNFPAHSLRVKEDINMQTGIFLRPALISSGMFDKNYAGKREKIIGRT